MTNYSVKLKTTFHASSLPVVSVQHPVAELGKHGNVRTVQINEVPEDISPAAVARLYSLTCDVTWLYGEAARQEFAYSELGEGKIIRYHPNTDPGTIPEPVLVSEYQKRLNLRRKTFAGGRPKSTDRCGCGLLTTKQAIKLKHACTEKGIDNSNSLLHNSLETKTP